MGDLKAHDRRWFRQTIGQGWGGVRRLFLVSGFLNLLALAAPIFSLQVFDRVLMHNGITTLQALLVGVAAALLFELGFRQLRSRLLQAMSVVLDVDLGRGLFEKLVALPLRTLESRPAAHWQGLFRDVDAVRNTLAGPAAALAGDLPFAFLFLGLIWIIAPPLFWVIVTALPAFVALAAWSGFVLRRRGEAEQERTQDRDGLVTDLAAGRTSVKALVLDDALRGRWEAAHARSIEASFARGADGDRYQNIGQTLSTVVTVAVTAVGAVAILDQHITVGALIATNLLAGRAIAPFVQLVGAWRQITQFRASLERLDDFFALPEERGDAALSLERPKGRLRLEDVSFRYRVDGRPALEELSGAVGPGGLHAIVGRNGSGKSTLLKLLRGLYAPEPGRVLLDEADLAQFTRRELARWIGYQPQECVIFTGSIRDNIALGDMGAPDERILAAARLAGVHDFVVDLPDGYASDVGEGGLQLSAGQRQRLALARALLMDPPVLLLDEPSSHLDQEAEATLVATLRQLAAERTVVVVSHAPALLAQCDSILVLERGRLALAGAAGAVLARLSGQPAQPARPAAVGGAA